MAKNTGNKATETKATSTAIVKVIPDTTAIAKGIGMKILNTLYDTYKSEQEIKGLVAKVASRKNEALATMIKVLYDAAIANKAIYMLFTGAFKGDRKVQSMANDTAMALMDMGTFGDDGKFTTSREVQVKFAKDKKADSPEFKRGDYAYKNFSTQMKTAMQNVVGAVDLKLTALEYDEDAGTLAIAGPGAIEVWGSDTVVLNGANKEQSLPEEIDGHKTPEVTMKTIRDLAAKKHSDKPAAPAVHDMKPTLGTGEGDQQSAMRKACAEFIGMVNSLEGKADADTIKSFISVANVIRPFLPEVNPAPRATDSVRAKEAATQVVRGVTLAATASRGKVKAKGEQPEA